MPTANDKQYGGDHYKGQEYQHWDFGSDLNLHGLIWCSSKYVSRWRDKAGMVDLKKADHFLEKAIERGDVRGVEPTDHHVQCLQRYIGQLPELEAEAIYEMVIGNFQGARGTIRQLMEQAK